MVGYLILACAVTFRGVVDIGPPPVLAAPSGPSVRLVLDVDSAPVGRLDGFSVDVTGPKFFGRLWVHDWRVVAAEDGSAPYVGFVRVTGSKVMVEDTGTGQLVELIGARELSQHADQRVLVVGYVVAAQAVQVMRWELLD